MWGTVELELAVANDGAGAAVAVAEDAFVEVAYEGAIGSLRDVSMGVPWCCDDWAGEKGTYLDRRLALLDLGVRELERANREVTIRVGFASCRRLTRRRNALWRPLCERRSREEEWSEDV